MDGAGVAEDRDDAAPGDALRFMTTIFKWCLSVGRGGSSTNERNELWVPRPANAARSQRKLSGVTEDFQEIELGPGDLILAVKGSEAEQENCRLLSDQRMRTISYNMQRRPARPMHPLLLPVLPLHQQLTTVKTRKMVVQNNPSFVLHGIENVKYEDVSLAWLGVGETSARVMLVVGRG